MSIKSRIARLERAIPEPPPPGIWERFECYQRARDPRGIISSMVRVMFATPDPPMHWRQYDEGADRTVIVNCAVFRRWIGERCAKLDRLIREYGEDVLDRHDDGDRGAIDTAALAALDVLNAHAPYRGEGGLGESQYEEWLAAHGYHR